jgi:hypothetical protein
MHRRRLSIALATGRVTTSVIVLVALGMGAAVHARGWIPQLILAICNAPPFRSS